MTLDPRTPILVGAGQFVQRPENPIDALEPVAMMRVALEAAADDAGARVLLDRATHTWVVKGAWPYTDPGRLIADAFGNSTRPAFQPMVATPLSPW